MIHCHLSAFLLITCGQNNNVQYRDSIDGSTGMWGQLQVWIIIPRPLIDERLYIRWNVPRWSLWHIWDVGYYELSREEWNNVKLMWYQEQLWCPCWSEVSELLHASNSPTYFLLWGNQHILKAKKEKFIKLKSNKKPTSFPLIDHTIRCPVLQKGKCPRVATSNHYKGLLWIMTS